MQTLLLVEDSRFLRGVIGGAFRNAGYLVTCAIDGEQAIASVHNAPPDLIVLDMLLPKITGPEVLRSLKNDASTSHIPVVVLSGLSKSNKEKLIQAGAAAFLEKGPLMEDPEPLLAAVRQALTKGGVH